MASAPWMMLPATWLALGLGASVALLSVTWLHVLLGGSRGRVVAFLPVPRIRDPAVGNPGVRCPVSGAKSHLCPWSQERQQGAMGLLLPGTQRHRVFPDRVTATLHVQW